MSISEETLTSSSVDRFPVPEALRNKKVLVMSESLGPINGVTRATQNLLEYLLQRGVRVAAVAPDFGKTDTLPLRKKMPLIRLSGTPIYYNPDLRVVHPFRLSKIFERTFQPDVIYLASPATLGLQVWWQLRKSNIPLVANFQTDLSSYALRMLPPGLNRAVGLAIDRVQGMCLRENCFKYILSPSHSSNDYLKSLKIPPAKLQLVGRGVDGVLFNPAKRSTALRSQLAPNGEILLLCISRLSLEKGFDFLAKAYEEMKLQAAERGITRKFRLVITGGNSNTSIEHVIKGYFEKHALDVVFTGPLLGETLAEMYAAADIFVYPSLTETFGQVIQEAMASALPVIARRKGGPADIVQPDVTGYLPEPDDVADFVDKTLLLIQDEEKRWQMSQAALAFAHTRSWDAINQQISQILAEAITSKDKS